MDRALRTAIAIEKRVGFNAAYSNSTDLMEVRVDIAKSKRLSSLSFKPTTLKSITEPLHFLPGTETYSNNYNLFPKLGCLTNLTTSLLKCPMEQMQIDSEAALTQQNTRRLIHSFY